MLTTLIRAIGQLCHANHLAPEPQPAPGPQPKPIGPTPATAPRAPTAHELEGLPLRYLIDTDTYGSGRDGEIVEVSYDATGKPAKGISVKYCNLFDEKDTGAYGPYLKTSDTAAEYHEGQIDPKGVGWTKNLTEQFARAVAQGFQYVELDNPDAYSVVDVLAAVSLAQRYGLKVIAKNPLLMPGDSTPYVAHPAVAGAIVERGAGSPADMDALRKKAGKTSLPVWFVAFGEGRAWAGNTANQAKQFGGMGVTPSAARRADMLSIFGTLLGWLNPLSAILGQIQQWEAKLLDAKTEQERIAAQERIAWYQAAATIAGHPIDMVLRALMAAPGILFVWKLIVYDKMLGWGSTEDLSQNLWYFAIALPWGFFFLHWTVGRLRS